MQIKLQDFYLSSSVLIFNLSNVTTLQVQVHSLMFKSDFDSPRSSEGLVSDPTYFGL